MQGSSKIYRGLWLASGIAVAVVMPPGSACAQPSLTQSNIFTGVPASTMATLARNVTETNPDITNQRQQVRIAVARLDAAKAGYMPTIEANGIVQKRELDVKNGGPGDAKFIAGQAAIEARLRVYDGNRTYNAIQVAKAELASAEAILAATVSDILLRLLTSAADIHLDRKVKQYSQMQSDAIGEQLRATSRKLQFQESTLTDESLAKARLATSQAGILSATEQLNVSGYNFRAVSGQSATTVPALAPLASLPDSLTQAQNLANANSPRLLAAQLNAEAGKTGVFFARGALMPQLDAVGGYEYLTGGVANLFSGKLPDDRSALYGGIELRVPVFQPRDYAEIRRARAVRDLRLSQTNAAVRTVAEEVSISWTRWQSAKNTIVAAEAAVAAIEQAAEGIKKESIGGNRTLAEVLDAQNELLSARVTLERAIRNEYVARAGVLATTGGLTAASVLEGRAPNRTDNPTRPELSPLGGKVIEPAPGNVLTSPAINDPIIETFANEVASGRESSTRPAVSTLGRKVMSDPRRLQ